MEKTNMRTFESSLITDFFKDQNWRCRAAIVTLRNRMDDDWVDLWLLDCFVKDGFEKDASLLTVPSGRLDCRKIPMQFCFETKKLAKQNCLANSCVTKCCPGWCKTSNGNNHFAMRFRET